MGSRRSRPSSPRSRWSSPRSRWSSPRSRWSSLSRPRPTRALIALAVLLTLVLTACGGSEAAEQEFSGSRLDNPFTAADVALTDTDGEPYALSETEKPLTLVFFGYTNCPDICPMVLNSLASAMTRLDAADREQVDVVFVTTDPARDTAPVVRRYLDRLDPSFIGLTGDLDDIIAVGEPLAVYVNDGTKLPSGGYDLGGHTSTVTAIDPDGRAPALWSQDTSAHEFATDVHTLLQED